MKTIDRVVNCWRLALVCGLLAVGCPHASGQQDTTNNRKIITRSTMVGGGGTNILDTYLSGEHYRGVGFSFLSTIERQRPGRHWSTRMEHEANLASGKDRAEQQQELEGAYNFYWGKLRGWELLDGHLKLQVGGMANASLGFIYNTSNGNNPAQARLHLNVMPTGVATYRFTLFNKQFAARYELNLPLVGIQFSPNYGQSYYELFNRGDYDHNLVFTTLATAPEWRNLLTLDAQLSRRITLRMGYLGNIQQSKVNSLRQHIWTHRFLIGITKRFSITPHTL